MIRNIPFRYTPNESESEKASNSYLMSLVVLMVGLPLPIINLAATFFFYLANRKSPYFVRWHCIHSLVSQFSVLLINSFGFWWTISILFGDEQVTNRYIAYLISGFLFNLLDFIATLHAAVKTRQGIHVEWWFYGNITHLLCKPDR